LTIGLAAAPLLAIALIVSVEATSQRSTAGPGERIRPPEGFECPLDWTTNYTGVVAGFSRDQARTVLDIRTDWDTTERVVIRHTGADGPERWFLLRGKPFGLDGWKAIESKPGQLRASTRASAWICLDKQNPVVDWTPAAEPPPPPVR